MTLTENLLPLNTTAKNKTGAALDVHLLKRMYELARPHRGALKTSVVLVLVSAALAPTRPYITQYIIDVQLAAGNMSGLITWSVVLLMILLAQTGILLAQTYLTNLLGQSIIKDLRIKVYAHINRLYLRFFDKTPVGTLVTRNVSDIETIADVFSEGMISIVGDILQLAFILGAMFYTDWKLALVSLSVFPLLAYSSYVFKESVKRSFQDVRNQVARLNTFVQEHITGMMIVQAFNREQAEMSRFKAINKDHRDANNRAIFAYSVFFPVVEVITALSIGLVVWYGSKQALQNELSLGVVVAFIMYINMFFRPIRQLADRFNTLQMGMVACERIFNLLDEKENLEPQGTVSNFQVKGHIQFKGVYFAYNPGEYVLRNIDLEVQPGKTMALVGATGAGKSSIINLLSRFYEIEKGDIVLDGVNIREADLHYLRKNIGVVLQDVFLFSGSVMDNITLFNPDITEQQVTDASKLIGAHEFISRLPNGYHQHVFERGATLSVGQRQLISFIRALVANPAVLVLDEATSSVDTETEELIQHAIQVMMRGRTSIVIAHRLSTILHADEIIVLDKGEIKERGSHEQLLKEGKYYRELYEMQFSPLAR